MRVCIASQEYPPETAHGGIGTQTWNKARMLTSLGHSVHVLSCGNRGEAAELRTRSEDGITVHRMRPPGEDPGDPVPLYDPSAYMIGYTWSVLRGIHRIAAEVDLDLVNFPEYGAEGFAYQVNRTPANWLPVVVQAHGPLAMFAQRVGWPDLDSRFYRVARFMEGESIRMADARMASSGNIADFVSDHYEVPRDSIDVVHCGLDCDVFRPPEEGAPRADRPTILFVGNIAASKGVKNVVEAVLRLRSRYPDIHLRILGRDTELRKQLAARVRSENAERHVEFEGFVEDRQKLPDYYRAAHVFASPADHEVGVANVYVEAMACGCPVVASTTGGAPEAVGDGVSGLLVPPRDVEALTAALDRLLGDASLRRRMGEEARRRATEYFAADHYIARVLGAYEKARERSREKLARMVADGSGA